MKKREEIQRKILLALLNGSKESKYRLQKETSLSYPTLLTYIDDLVNEGYIETGRGTRKNGKPDRRGTTSLKITTKGLAWLILKGELEDEELALAIEKATTNRHPILIPSFWINIIGESPKIIFENIIRRLRPRVNFEFFDEKYFSAVLDEISFDTMCEIMLKQAKEEKLKKRKRIALRDISKAERYLARDKEKLGRLIQLTKAMLDFYKAQKDM